MSLSTVPTPPALLPPSNIKAEQALLGAMLANNKAYERVPFLHPSHFADPIHGRIFRAVQTHIEAGRVVDTVLLRHEFENAGVLDEVGGVKYLVDLLSAMVGIINAADYGLVVFKTWQRRELIDLAFFVSNAAFCPSEDFPDPTDIIADVERRLFKIAGASVGSGDGVPLQESVRTAVQEGEDVRAGRLPAAISSGLPSIDDKILSLRPGNLLILAARPGIGKTTLAKSIALNVALGRQHYGRRQFSDVAERARTVLYFCFESSKSDFGAICTSELADVTVDEVMRAGYSNAGAERVIVAEKLVREAPLRSFHKKMTLSDIRRIARSEASRSKIPLGLIVVDYLQLMPDHPGKDKRLSVGANVYGLKDLAMELDVPVICLSQLSRAVEQRPDKRPVMADLRETSEIEDAADVIMFLYREAYYFGKTRPPYDSTLSPAANGQALAEWQARYDQIESDAELLIEKCRRGKAPEIVRPRFNGPFSRFEENADAL